MVDSSSTIRVPGYLFLLDQPKKKIFKKKSLTHLFGVAPASAVGLPAGCQRRLGQLHGRCRWSRRHAPQRPAGGPAHRCSSFIPSASQGHAECKPGQADAWALHILQCLGFQSSRSQAMPMRESSLSISTSESRVQGSGFRV